MSENSSVGATEIAQFLNRLGEIYGRRGRAAEFESEKEAYQEILPALADHIGRFYKLVGPIQLGSTATVWEVLDVSLDQRRALKLSRPRKDRLERIVKVIRAEPKMLAGLQHQNIIKVYNSGELPTKSGQSLPFFIMEYLDGIQDFNEAIKDSRLKAVDLLDYFRDVLTGLSFLHAQNIIHCDVKPGNLLIAPDRPALVADLGYSKYLYLRTDSDASTQLITTHRYAHPELLQHVEDSADPSATVIEMRHAQLSPRYDLYALGRTFQEVLVKLKESESLDPGKEFGRRSVFSNYQWRYLSLISKRLLDGVVMSRSGDDLQTDFIPGLKEDVMNEIKYQTADDALEDLEKLAHLYDLEGLVPELNPDISSYIQIPHCHVPLTERVRDIVYHPMFDRLTQTSQLGFVSLVYPGAVHTRYEHVLGSFAHCCEYLRALWYDDANPLFQCIMSREHLEVGLLAALLHDVSQYPMAHDLTEIDARFAHERLASEALECGCGDSAPSLALLIHHAWNVGVDEVMSVLRGDENSSFRHRLLMSVIDGVLDCDKLDYLRRDSSHLGVEFGSAIDHERLKRNLTVVYGRATSEGQGDYSEDLGLAEIGVAEKALVVAKALVGTRRDMFTQVYWQHTTRSLKAMLGYIVREVLSSLHPTGREELFWASFHTFVFDPWAFYSQPSPKSAGSGEDSSLIHDLPEMVDSGETPRYSKLCPSDDAALNFLWRFASGSARDMILAIRRRKLYQRVAVLSGSRDRSTYRDIYDQFRTYSSKGLFNELETDRKHWEEKLKDAALRRLEKWKQLLPAGYGIGEVRESFGMTDPIILVDVPIKSGNAAPEFIRFLREDYSGIHGRRAEHVPVFSSWKIERDDLSFDVEVGKIRVFAHPRHRSLLIRTVRDTEIFKVIRGGEISEYDDTEFGKRSFPALVGHKETR